MPSIAIITGNHLCHNPRVFKEASALVRGGYNVEVIGAWLDSTLKGRDQELMSCIPFRYTPILDFTKSSIITILEKQIFRLRNKAAQSVDRMLGFENSIQLGCAVDAMRQAVRQNKADLFIAHSEAGLAVAQELLSNGQRVGVDMEDWFSEDLLPEARRNRPVRLLQKLERSLLCSDSYSTCPSKSMSDALAHEFDCKPPLVIYNAFPWADRETLDGQIKDRRDCFIPSVHWYSQTIGPGRGLEDLLASLPDIQYPVEIHLRGTPVSGFDKWLAQQIPVGWSDKVFLHGLVSNESLLSRIAEHDIGFAGEMKYCRSRDLTVTNKILHYLLGGLAVVASDTVGQQEVAEKAKGAVLLYPSGDSGALAARLNELIASTEILRSAKAAALKAAKETFCWEQQERVLIEGVELALGMTKKSRCHEEICSSSLLDR